MAVSVTNVDKINSKRVKLTFTGAVYGASYTCTVSNVKCTEGATIDPAHNTAMFDMPDYGWAQKTPGGAPPTERYAHSMAFDSSRNLVFITCGYDNSGSIRTTAKYDHALDTWTSRTASPYNSVYGKMTYDSKRDLIVWYQGVDSNCYTTEYNINTNAWTYKATGGPSGMGFMGLYGFAMCYDPVLERTILFGGQDRVGTRKQSIWQWDGSAWTETTVSGGKPSARSFLDIVYDSTRGKYVLFGGYTGSPNNETWEFDPSTATWAQLSPAVSPSARSTHALAYNSDNGTVILFGGYNGAAYINDTWEFSYDAMTWYQISPAVSPSIRGYAQMVYDPNAQRCILYGGYDGTILNTTFTYLAE